MPLDTLKNSFDYRNNLNLKEREFQVREKCEGRARKQATSSSKHLFLRGHNNTTSLVFFLICFNAKSVGEELFKYYWKGFYQEKWSPQNLQGKKGAPWLEGPRGAAKVNIWFAVVSAYCRKQAFLLHRHSLKEDMF